MPQTAESLGTGVRAWGAGASTIHVLLALVFLLALPRVAGPQDVSKLRSDDPYKISVNVARVVLHVTVENHKGAPVAGLGKDDFQVYEDGVRQPIEYFSHEDIPVTVGLVLDNSGSMGPKRNEVIAAALAFAHHSNPEDQMFVVHFNEHVTFGLPADTPFTDKTSELQVALSKFKTSGETALYDALAAAIEHLKMGDRDKKVIIVVSDGGDNASKYKLSQILAMAEKSDAIIYTIGVYTDEDPDKKPEALRALARATGGEANFPQSLEDVVPLCEHIAGNIREQYTITYDPLERTQNGKYRAIQVKAIAPGHGRLYVRTRAGYYAPSIPQPVAPLVGSQSNRP
ncbi:MAG: VWA domain-containing protein [Terriglobia bacterium]